MTKRDWETVGVCAWFSFLMLAVIVVGVLALSGVQCPDPRAPL